MWRLLSLAMSLQRSDGETPGFATLAVNLRGDGSQAL
jgi:hypothetical protein